MTMPHLMNCPHLADGWCLSCVKKEIERLTILPHDDPRSFNIVERLQRIIDTADERELDETEVRAMRDAIDEIQRLRNVILDELSARDQELGLQ